MTVALYSDKELRALGLRLSDAADAPRNDVFLILTALGLANRAACLMSGSNVAKMERPNLGASIKGERNFSGWELGDWCRNLLFNCIASDGNDFAPKSRVVELKQLMVRADCSAD